MTKSMQRQGLAVWPEGDCLLSRLKDELLLYGKDELQNVIVVLPTQRLATCLVAILAEHFQACFPPVTYTWETLLTELCPDMVDESGQIWSEITDHCLELVITSLIRQGSYRHIHLGHAHELKQFFSDLEEHQFDEENLTGLISKLEGDYYRDQQHLTHLNQRIEEIRHLFLLLKESLAGRNLMTSLQAQKFRSRCLCEAWTSQDLEFRHVYFACFTTVKACFKPVWKVLSEINFVSMWFSQPPKVLSAVNPLKEFIDSLKNEGESRPVQIGNSSQNHNESELNVHSCSSWIEEVARGMEIAGHYIRQGCPPSQIAILLTSESRYGKILRTFLNDMDTEANIAIATSLAQTQTGSWLGVLFEYFECHDKDAHALCRSFLTHKLTLNLLLSKLNIEDSQRTEEVFASLSESLLGTIKSMKACPLSLQDVMNHLSEDETKKALGELELILRPLWTYKNRHQSGQIIRQGLREWGELLDQILLQFGLWGLQEDGDKGVGESGAQAMAGLIDAVNESGSLVNPHLSAQEFIQIIKEKMHSLETRSIGYPLKGIQVLSLIESRFIPFQVVILLGCIEGEFPKGLPKDLLMDEWLKGLMGLPGWQYVEALEDTTFQLLQSRIPHLELLYSREQNHVPTVRSRFIETLYHQNPDLNIRYADDQSFRPIFKPDRLGEIDLQSLNQRKQNSGLKIESSEKLLTKFSAGSLENLLQCSFRFILDQFCQGFEQIGQESDAIEEGKFLHKIMELFFRGGKAGTFVIKPLPKTISADQWISFAADRFNVLSQAILPASSRYMPLIIHMKEFGWPKLSESMLGFFERDQSDRIIFPEDWLCEWSMGGGQGVQIPSQTLFEREDWAGCKKLPTINLRGVADRVDLYQGLTVISDYKRRSIPIPKDVSNAKKPQLLLYTIAMEFDTAHGYQVQASSTSLSYWNLIDGEIKTVAFGGDEMPKGSRRATGPAATKDAVSNLKIQWFAKLNGLVEESQTVYPSPGEVCRFCQWSGACRRFEPGMMAYFKGIASKNALGAD